MHITRICNKEYATNESRSLCDIDYFETTQVFVDKLSDKRVLVLKRNRWSTSEWLQYLSAIVCCSLMPTLNSTGNTRRGLPPLISSGKVWKTSWGNGTSTMKWSLNAGREKEKWKVKEKRLNWYLIHFAMLRNLIRLGGCTIRHLRQAWAGCKKRERCVCMYMSIRDHKCARQIALQIDTEWEGWSKRSVSSYCIWHNAHMTNLK